MGFELYDFQQEDVEKILKAKSGLIGSEMGTGKTHEAIALDEAWYRRVRGTVRPRTLVVAPLNTHSSWLEKYQLQSPDSDVMVIDRKNRDRFADAVRNRKGDVFVCHYEALHLIPELCRYQYQTVILDEAHRIANRKAAQTRAAYRIGSQAKHRLALSGTASGDKPHNLWSILHWLWPTYYRSYWKFFKHYVETYTDPGNGYQRVIGVNEENIPFLHKEMEPFYVRHLKKETCCPHHPGGVMSYLPDKVYDRVWVDLSPEQRRFYERMRQDMIIWVGEHQQSPLTTGIVVAQLARLSQITLGTPSSVEYGTRWVVNKKTGLKEEVPTQKLYISLPSSKIQAAVELIQDANKQVVVFTSSKQAAYLTAQALATAGITSEVLSGDTPQSARPTMVSRFVRGDYDVFIGVIAPAAEGIDGLQHATDTAIFLDRSWSTIKNQQAEDRLHRGGTKNTVQIIDIMARGTLDSGRHQALVAKWSWIKAILGDGLNQMTGEVK